MEKEAGNSRAWKGSSKKSCPFQLLSLALSGIQIQAFLQRFTKCF